MVVGGSAIVTDAKRSTHIHAVIALFTRLPPNLAVTLCPSPSPVKSGEAAEEWLDKPARLGSFSARKTFLRQSFRPVISSYASSIVLTSFIDTLSSKPSFSRFHSEVYSCPRGTRTVR